MACGGELETNNLLKDSKHENRIRFQNKFCFLAILLDCFWSFRNTKFSFRTSFYVAICHCIILLSWYISQWAICLETFFFSFCQVLWTMNYFSGKLHTIFAERSCVQLYSFVLSLVWILAIESSTLYTLLEESYETIYFLEADWF